MWAITANAKRNAEIEQSLAFLSLTHTYLTMPFGKGLSQEEEKRLFEIRKLLETEQKEMILKFQSDHLSI